jgi:hypothetical protein
LEKILLAPCPEIEPRTMVTGLRLSAWVLLRRVKFVPILSHCLSVIEWISVLNISLKVLWSVIT